MNEETFREYLKWEGRKPAVVDRCVSALKDFASCLLKKREKSLDGVTTDDIDAFLWKLKVRNNQQKGMRARTKKQREQLSKKLDIPEDAILELVKLSDITRIGYVKKKLSRLYYNSGLDSPAKIAEFEPKQLHEFFVKFIDETGWDGMVPNPKDLVSNIKSARKLSKIVEE
jgi:hypothetical protein